MHDNFVGHKSLYTLVRYAAGTNYSEFKYARLDMRSSALFFRPHRSTTYVDAAYCYRPSSVVCRSVCRSVTLVSPAKTDAPILGLKLLLTGFVSTIVTR